MERKIEWEKTEREEASLTQKYHISITVETCLNGTLNFSDSYSLHSDTYFMSLNSAVLSDRKIKGKSLGAQVAKVLCRRKGK